MKKQPAGFTLVEVIVAIGIIGVIMAIGTDLFSSVIKTSNRATVINTLKQSLSGAFEEMERAIRGGYSLPSSEMISGERAYVTIVNQDHSQAVRYRICQLNPSTRTCLQSPAIENTTEVCPEGVNCVGHVRKYGCARQSGSSDTYLCDQDLGSLTSLDTVSGVDLITPEDRVGTSDNYSRFTIVPTARGVTVQLKLVALQGPNAPSRSDYRVCESTDIGTCQGLVELSSTVSMRQK